MTNVYQYICGSQQLSDPNCWAQYDYCDSCKNTSNTNGTGEVIANYTGNPNATLNDIVKVYPNATNFFFLDDDTLYLDTTVQESQLTS